MNAAARAPLVAAAKARATAVVSCVQSRLSPCHILDRCSRDDLVALVVVLAEAADPAVLRAVVDVRDDDGRPDLTRLDAKLREAHSQVVMLVRRKQHVPQQLRVLDREYRRRNREAEGQQRGEADDRAA